MPLYLRGLTLRWPLTNLFSKNTVQKIDRATHTTCLAYSGTLLLNMFMTVTFLASQHHQCISRKFYMQAVVGHLT